MSLKNIGELTGVLDSLGNLNDIKVDNDKVVDLALEINKLKDVGDVKKFLNMSGVSKDVARAAVDVTDFAKDVDDIIDSIEDGAETVGDILEGLNGKFKNFTNATKSVFKGIGSVIAAHPIITGIAAITAAGVAAYSVYKNYKKNMMETATASSLPSRFPCMTAV